MRYLPESTNMEMLAYIQALNSKIKILKYYLKTSSTNLPFQIRFPLSVSRCLGWGAGWTQTPLSICASSAGQSFMKAPGVIRTLLMNSLYSSSQLCSSVCTICLYIGPRWRSLWSTISDRSDFGDRHAASGNGAPLALTVDAKQLVLTY